MTDSSSSQKPEEGLSELEGEELIEVVRQTVTDLQTMLDRLQRYVGEDA